ncbi:C1 family peptidase [Bacteroidota bacterium]
MKSSIRIFVILSFVFLTNQIWSQDEGQITKEMLNTYRTTLNVDQSITAVINAVTNNEINKLAMNRNNLGKVDTYFKYQVKIKGITDQKSSGRCWLYTGLNVLRIKIIENYNLDQFEFSQNYSFFYDQLEKANLFLEGIIATREKPMDDRTVEWFFRHPVGDGGQWTGVVDIVTKYGLIPAEVMPETNSSTNTRMMSRFIRGKLREFGLELREMHKNSASVSDLRSKKENMLSDIYRLLVITLGEPPETFTWRYKDTEGNLSELKEYTPLSFYKEIVNIDLNDYIMFMNDPSRPYNKLFEIEYDRHMQEGKNWKYINLPVTQIKEFALLSIMDNEAMYFSCDVGKQLDKERGYLDINNYDYNALFGISFDMDKKQRIITGESSSSHGMALIGVDVDDKNVPDKWLLENSWGSDAGFNGYLIMTDDWFDEYMFRVVIHKKYVADKILNILDQEAIKLPPWDPMFLPEE